MVSVLPEDKTVVIISGTNKGIGLGLLHKYAALPDHIVIGTVLGQADEIECIIGTGSSIIRVEMDVTDVEGPKRAIKELQSRYGITKLDIAISNAAILTSQAMARIEDIDPQAFEDHWRVNVKGNLLFFQACRPLLRAGSKFVFISSGAGVLDRVPDRQNVCYGITKIGATYLARYAHFEHPELIIFPLWPGWVRTDMGKLTAKHLGLDDGTVTVSVDESAAGLQNVINNATRETHSGYVWNYDGTPGKW